MHVLSQIWSNIGNDLFPELEKVLPPLSEKQRKLVAILELIRIEKYAGKLNLTYFGRPKKGEEHPPVELKRIEKQLNQTLEQMLAELPTACDRGTKKDSKGYKHTWNGYKLHLDVDDNGIPIKEEFGACMVRVRGAAKVFAHLMFGILALAADQLLKLVQYVSYYQIVTKTLWRYSAPKSTKFLF